LGVQFALGAFAAGLFCAISIGFVKNNCRVKEDAVMGIIFSGMFALGLVLLTKIETDIHLLHILFGNVLGITTEDMVEAGLIAAIASLVMLIKRRDLLLYCFDPAHAAALGLPVKWLHFGLLVFLAVTIVSALKAAGIILVIAMLIAPGAIGFLLSRSFDRMLAIAVGVSVISCLAGTILSYHMDSATAPLIVVIQSAIFIFVLAISQLKQGRAKADVIAA
ncbi:MAG TPA: iron ABC transporter permease, partial [Rhodospirillaceae bacterium]|nr:iron ABC transporter permease [Rhodospirillaceae bacterium]